MATKTMIRVHYHAAKVRSLGPGSRFVLWTQGCPRRCPGCVAPEAQDVSGGKNVSVDAMAEKILRAKETDGLTISGGEPFMQAAALCELIEKVRARRDMGVIVYTGYTLEELRAMEDAGVQALLGMIDLLIDGPYIEERNDDRTLRGSDNQRVICLTDRYAGDLGMYGSEDRRALEYRVTQNGFFVIGIPDRLRAAMLGIGGKDEDRNEDRKI